MKTEQYPNLIEKYEFNGQPPVDRPDLENPEGWSLALLAEISRVRNHALSPDGEWVAFIWDQSDLSDVYLLPTKGGWPRRVSFGRGPTISWDDELPAWSPDSKWLAFSQDDHVHIVPVGLTGSLPRMVTDFTGAASSPTWLKLPDGSLKLIVSVERRNVTQLVITDCDGTWPRPLASQYDGDAWEPVASRDGKWVAYVFRPFEDLNRLDIRLVNLSTGITQTIAGQQGIRQRGPAFSAQSDKIAFLSQVSGFYEIWIANIGETGLDRPPQQLTHLGADCAELAWSPDGQKLAFTVNRGGSFELVVVDANTGEVSTLRGDKGVHSRPNWLPDSQSLTVEFESPLLPPDIYCYGLTGGGFAQLTFSTPPALAGLHRKMPEEISFLSLDGIRIPGLVYRPTISNGAGVVNPHGGPGDQSTYMWDPFAQFLAACGYTIVQPNYRGSTGYGLEFEHKNYFDWGGGDVGDCLAAADLLARQPGVDRARLGSMGASYGGYLTNAALARDPEYRFSCGVSIFGDANLLTSWALCSKRLRLYSEIYLGKPAEQRQVYVSGSPVFEASKVRSPLLLLHGLEDDIVPPEASEEWANALRIAGKTFEYKTYTAEPHGFLRRVNRLDAWQRIMRFLNWYLLPKKV